MTVIAVNRERCPTCGLPLSALSGRCYSCIRRNEELLNLQRRQTRAAEAALQSQARSGCDDLITSTREANRQRLVSRLSDHFFQLPDGRCVCAEKRTAWFFEFENWKLSPKGNLVGVIRFRNPDHAILLPQTDLFTYEVYLGYDLMEVGNVIFKLPPNGGLIKAKIKFQAPPGWISWDIIVI